MKRKSYLTEAGAAGSELEVPSAIVRCRSLAEDREALCKDLNRYAAVSERSTITPPPPTPLATQLVDRVESMMAEARLVREDTSTGGARSTFWKNRTVRT